MPILKFLAIRSILRNRENFTMMMMFRPITFCFLVISTGAFAPPTLVNQSPAKLSYQFSRLGYSNGRHAETAHLDNMTKTDLEGIIHTLRDTLKKEREMKIKLRKRVKMLESEDVKKIQMTALEEAREEVKEEVRNLESKMKGLKNGYDQQVRVVQERLQNELTKRGMDQRAAHELVAVKQEESRRRIRYAEEQARNQVERVEISFHAKMLKKDEEIKKQNQQLKQARTIIESQSDEIDLLLLRSNSVRENVRATWICIKERLRERLHSFKGASLIIRPPAHERMTNGAARRMVQSLPANETSVL